MDDTVKSSVISTCRSGRRLDVQAILTSLQGEPAYVEYCKVAMFEACRVGKADIVDYLVHGSACTSEFLINSTDENGGTPLHVACKQLNVNVCMVIFQHGKCNVNVQTFTGQTPLHLAVLAKDGKLESKLQIIHLLLAVPDCDPNIIDSKGDTPLMVACKGELMYQAQNLKITKVLISYIKCNPNRQDHDGNTALHFAAAQGCVRILEALACCTRLEPNLSNQFGVTALHEACAILSVKAVTALLKKAKCIVNAQTVTGQTPLHRVVKASGDNPDAKVKIINVLFRFPDCDPLLLMPKV